MPKSHLSVIAPARDTQPRHSHTPGYIPPVRVTAEHRKCAPPSCRQFALITLPIAFKAGLVDKYGEPLDHDLSRDQLLALSFATIRDRRPEDDSLVTQAPLVIADHNFADALAAQLNLGQDMGIGDLTYVIDAADLPDSATVHAEQSLAA